MKFKCGHEALLGVGDLCMACHNSQKHEPTDIKEQKTKRARGKVAGRNRSLIKRERQLKLGVIIRKLHRKNHACKSYQRYLVEQMKEAGMPLSMTTLSYDMRELGWYIKGGHLIKREGV